MTALSASPCQNRCGLDETRSFCIACQRTLPEIAGWGQLMVEAREKLTADLPGRDPASLPELANRQMQGRRRTRR